MSTIVRTGHVFSLESFQDVGKIARIEKFRFQGFKHSGTELMHQYRACCLHYCAVRIREKNENLLISEILMSCVDD